jgi:hypothetical protein
MLTKTFSLPKVVYYWIGKRFPILLSTQTCALVEIFRTLYIRIIEFQNFKNNRVINLTRKLGNNKCRYKNPNTLP